MKHIILIALILMQILIFTACREKTDTLMLDNIKGTENLVRTNTLSVSDDNTSSKSKDNTIDGSIGSNSFYIIAESGNSISSEDKEKVIKKLDDELGTLFDSINNLDDK